MSDHLFGRGSLQPQYCLCLSFLGNLAAFQLLPMRPSTQRLHEVARPKLKQRWHLTNLSF